MSERKPIGVTVPYRKVEKGTTRKVSERNIRLTIGMMRSMASCKPISPFHLEASKEMEKMLEELLDLRKKLKEKNT